MGKRPGDLDIRLLLAALFVLAAVRPGQAALPGGAEAIHPQPAQEALADLTRKAPYLIYPGDPTRMQVLWQLTATATSTIEWGPDTTCSLGSAQTAEYGADYQHAHVIGDLAPGTTYHYRVTTEGVIHRGSFTSGPAADAARVKFFAYGDTRSYPATHDWVAGGMNSIYAADPEFQTFALVVGDLVNNGGSETDWTAQFFNPAYPNILTLLAHLPYQSCMGNHEGTGALFVKYFPYPFVGGRYWSFDYGPAHFVVVDQYTSYAPGSAQLQWITDDLLTSYKPWKFLCLHEPGWSAYGGHANNVAVQTYLQPLCENLNVSVVFAGHNHYYARAVVNRVQHVTTGGGGAPLASPFPNSPNVVATALANHFCTVAIDGNTLHLEALTPAGAVLDSFTLVTTTTAAPTRPAWSRVAAHPNPFSSETRIEYRLVEGGAGRLVILDVAGREVRSFPGLGPGSGSVRWDGASNAGEALPAGIYFCRLESAVDSATGKVFLLRH